MDNPEQYYRVFVDICKRNANDSRWLSKPVVTTNLRYKLVNDNLEFIYTVRVRLYRNGAGVKSFAVNLNDALDQAELKVLNFEKRYRLRKHIETLKNEIRSLRDLFCYLVFRIRKIYSSF
jgi:hypothetical protein